MYMKDKKNAFALVELIVAIVILAILALIVTPLVLNIVKKAKDTANKRNIDNYAKAIEMSITNNLLESNIIKTGRYYSLISDEGKNLYNDNQELVLKVDYTGESVACDIVDINQNGSIYLKNCTVNDKKIDYEYGKQVVNTLMSSGKSNGSKTNFLSTDVSRNLVLTLNIVSEIDIPSGYSSSDCSEKQDGSVMCWWKESADSPGYYDMYIGANGVVYAPSDSSYLFSRVGYDLMTDFDLGSNFDTSNATNMNGMFASTGYTSMVNFSLGSYFDTSKVTDMSVMFSYTGYNSMTTLDLGNKFDTSSVTDMQQMFESVGYNSMTTLDLGDKFDTSNVTNMSYMFREMGHNSMTTLNLGNKFDTSKVTNMNWMFENTGYNSMTTLDLGNKFDTSNVTNMINMFSGTGYNSMIELDLGDKFDTSNVKYMYNIFIDTGHNSLMILNLGIFGVNIDEQSYFLGLFYGCGSNTLSKVIVADKSIKDWLIGLDSRYVPEYFKNAIVVEN